MTRCGASQIDITPPIGVRLAGYGNRTDPSNAIHDPLYAQVLYFQDENQVEVVLISLDLIGVDRDFTAHVRSKIHQSTQIPMKNIMVTCTHTHAGPDGFAILFPRETQIDKDFQELRNDTAEKLAIAVQIAKGKARNAQFWYGTEQTEGICTNRNNPQIRMPNTVTTLRIDAVDGLIALLVSYGCHPTILSAKNLCISADFPGVMRINLHKSLGVPVVMFLNSGSGDVSTRFTRRSQDFVEVDRIGKLLADYALEANRKSTQITANKINSISRSIDLPLRDFPSAVEADKVLRSLEQEYKNLQAKLVPIASLRIIETKIIGARVQARFSREMTSVKELTTEVQGIRLGDLVLVSIPGEPFTEVVERIKRQTTRTKPLVISYANDYIGYIPIDTVEDTYETLKSPWKSELGNYVADHCLSIVNALIDQEE